MSGLPSGDLSRYAGATPDDPAARAVGADAAPRATGAEPDMLRDFPDTDWFPGGPGAPSDSLEDELEAGRVLRFPHLRFALSAQERRFLDPRWTNGKTKNITLRPGATALRGASGDVAEQAELLAMIDRYRASAEALVQRLFPHYTGKARPGNTTFRPVRLEGRATSWRQDDTRLHVDAFPSNPTRGARLLRVFHNANPDGVDRLWRVGEPFEAIARHFVPTIGRPLPGSAALLKALGITKSRRTEYDHLMLRLHDRMKSDAGYQRSSPQRAVAFAPGETWLVFSDQVSHAAMAGQHMLEYTLWLEAADQHAPERSPLRTLERLTGRPLA